MALTSSRTTIDVGTQLEATWSLRRDGGRPLAAESCAALCDEAAFAAATSFRPGEVVGEVLASIDLRSTRKLPSPGTYTLVISATDPETPGPPALLPVEVVLGGDRSCLVLAGVAPTVTYSPPDAATLSLKLFNRCGHTFSADVKLSWGDGEVRIEPTVSIGAGSTVDVQLRLPVGSAIDDLRNGRVPDDVQVVVSKTGSRGGVELTLDRDDLIMQGISSSGQAAQTSPPARTNRGASRARNSHDRRDRIQSMTSIARRAMLWGGGVAAAVLTLVAILNQFGNEPDVTAGSPAQAASPSAEAEDRTDERAADENDDRNDDDQNGEDQIGEDDEEDEDDDRRTVGVGHYTGLTRAAAEDAASADGLAPIVDTVETDDPDADGVVLGQDPPPERTVIEGAAVALSVGEFIPRPEPMLIVPALLGFTATDAAAVAEASRLTPVFVDVGTNDPDDHGVVVGQDPEPGTMVAERSTVTLSIGRFDVLLMPDLTGLADQQAAQRLDELLRAAGSSSPDSRYERRCDGPGGGVITAQEPAAGTEVSEPFEVRLIVSVSCREIPKIVNLRLSAAASDLAAWQGEGRTYSLDTSCVSQGSSGDDPQITSLRPRSTTVAASFSISCVPIR